MYTPTNYIIMSIRLYDRAVEAVHLKVRTGVIADFVPPNYCPPGQNPLADYVPPDKIC